MLASQPNKDWQEYHQQISSFLLASQGRLTLDTSLRNYFGYTKTKALINRLVQAGKVNQQLKIDVNAALSELYVQTQLQQTSIKSASSSAQRLQIQLQQALLYVEQLQWHVSNLSVHTSGDQITRLEQKFQQVQNQYQAILARPGVTAQFRAAYQDTESRIKQQYNIVGKWRGYIRIAQPYLSNVLLLENTLFDTQPSYLAAPSSPMLDLLETTLGFDIGYVLLAFVFIFIVLWLLLAWQISQSVKFTVNANNKIAAEQHKALEQQGVIAALEQDLSNQGEVASKLQRHVDRLETALESEKNRSSYCYPSIESSKGLLATNLRYLSSATKLFQSKLSKRQKIMKTKR